MAFINSFSSAAFSPVMSAPGFLPGPTVGGLNGSSQGNPLGAMMMMMVVQEMLQAVAALSASWSGMTGGDASQQQFGLGGQVGFNPAPSPYGAAPNQQCMPSPLGVGSNPYGSPVDSMTGMPVGTLPTLPAAPLTPPAPTPTPGVLTDEGRERLAKWNAQMRDEGAQTFHPTNPDVIDAINNGDMQAAHRFGRHHGDPLTLDLNGDGIGTSDSKINFDMGGDGQQSSINDIAQGDGTLVIGNGADGGQLLGDKTDLSQFGGGKGFADGFDALKAMADLANKEGLFNAEEQKDLANGTLDAGALDVLSKNFGLGIKKDSLTHNAQSLASAGVTSIQLGGAKTTTENFDGRGNNLETAAGAGFTRVDGSSGAAADLWMQLNSARV